MRCRWRHNVDRCIRMMPMSQRNIEEMAPIIRSVTRPVPIAGQSIEEMFRITATRDT